MFSDKLTFQPTSSFTPDEPGTPFGGGYYAGRIMVNGREYALVVAPKAQGGESAGALQWNTSISNTPGTDSRNDGWSNTQAMMAAGASLHPAGNFCNSLSINGYTDWYLPSQDELEILYRAFKPSDGNNNTSRGANPSSVPPTGNYTLNNPTRTGVDIFIEGGAEAFTTNLWYWSSTQATPINSHIQVFNSGNQGAGNKGGTRGVRGVRRVAV